MRDDKENLIVNKTFNFALDAIDYSEKLRSLHKYEMASQLFRSGTSIGANVWEAQNAESNADFIHKFKIAAKESDETNYWLKLCKASPHYPDPKPELPTELNSIIRIISRIISSSKKK
ncbi:four helix bundle protein [Salinimicrobium catena]|uniref:Four helix bundle protein n=1 Tax=Salinimicrobium catena TaxID=390640 RepID=A0A1H5IAX0_9FLAO|nr:four helix bundle protein [Salinimicrobium catena]SDK76215.1 four helix bundle protein [Salinimicrobium catena]SEE37340.1 four helix bundle protein [Salinimicrobium catena]